MKLGVVAIVLFSASVAWAQQVCDTRSYAASSPAARFEDSGDGTLIDRQSKLMWMRCSLGQRWADGHCTGNAAEQNWQTAQAEAAQLNQRGEYFYKDWRLPQVQELASIAERECGNPRINLALFPNTPAEYYWTASSRRGAGAEPAAAFALSFGGDGISFDAKTEAKHVRLVRNAQ